MYQSVCNQDQYIHVSENGIIIKKPLTKGLTSSEKLDQLQLRLEIIAKKYGEQLRLKGISEEDIQNMSNEYVEQTFRHYAINFSDMLDSVISYLDYTIKTYENHTIKRSTSLVK